MRNSRHILLLLCLGSSVSAAVQTQKPISQMPASARQLIGVKVTGSDTTPKSTELSMIDSRTLA